MADWREVAVSLSAQCFHGVHRDSSISSNWVEAISRFYQHRSVCAMGLLGYLPHGKELDCFLYATKDEATCESTLWSETTNVLLQFGQLFVHRAVERNRYCAMS